MAVNSVRHRLAEPWLVYLVAGLAAVGAYFLLPPVPSAADVFYLAGYPLIAAGIAVLFLGFGARERRAGLIDAALLTVAFALARPCDLLAQRRVANGRVSLPRCEPRLPIRRGRDLRNVDRQVREDDLARHRLAAVVRVVGGVAALHPSMTALSDRVRTARP